MELGGEIERDALEYYLIQRNRIISILFLIQHNCILPRLSSI